MFKRLILASNIASSNTPSPKKLAKKVLATFICASFCSCSFAGNVYTFKDKKGNELLTNVSDKKSKEKRPFNRYEKKVKVTWYKDKNPPINKASDSKGSATNSLNTPSFNNDGLNWHTSAGSQKSKPNKNKPQAKIGMTKKQVLNSTKWGKPNFKRTSVSALGKFETWHYSYGLLVFKDGRLSSMHY